MLARLSYNGTAAFLLSNGSLGADAEEYKIRKKLIENHKVEAIINLPRDMFYATDIPVSLWICGNHKKPKKVKREGKEVVLRNRENEILFIDARYQGDNGNNEDGFTMLTEESKKLIAQTLFDWQSPEWKTRYHDVPEFCYSASMDEIRNKDWTLVPSRYIEFVNRDSKLDYKSEMAKIQSIVKDDISEQKKTHALLEKSFAEVGYELN